MKAVQKCSVEHKEKFLFLFLSFLFIGYMGVRNPMLQHTCGSL